MNYYKNLEKADKSILIAALIDFEKANALYDGITITTEEALQNLCESLELPDYAKGCARYNEITCDCDLTANECKSK